MTDHETRSVLTVFLASPGDLPDERLVARELVTELNRSVGVIGWSVQLLGWEDRAPGAGRPQELINEYVDRCDLFIGMLWRKWGSETGEYSSGFEEEFERAINRWKSDGTPQIWMVFKKVEPQQLEDPGEQLQKVSAFRAKIVENNTLFFREIVGPEDFRNLLREWLWQYILGRTSESYEASVRPPGASVAVTPPKESEQTLDLQMSASQGQAVELLGEVLDAAKREEELGGVRAVIGDGSVARLNLLGKSLFAERYRTEHLSSHEINALYESRETLKTSFTEKLLLLSTILADDFDYSPGWYWFQTMTPSNVDAILFWSLDNLDDAAKQGAIELLQMVQLKPPNPKSREYLKVALTDDELSVQRAALKYLVKVGDSDELTLIEEVFFTDDDSQPITEAVDARLTLQARVDPESLAQKIVEEAGVSRVMESRLDELSESASKETLEAALEHSSPYVRAWAVKEMARREVIDVDRAKKLLEDSSLKVREYALRFLVRSEEISDLEDIRRRLQPAGRPDKAGSGSPGFLGLSSMLITPREESVDVDDVVREALAMSAASELKGKVDWLSIDGHLAYEVYAQTQFADAREELLKDLGEEFKTFRDTSVNAMRAQYGEVGVAMLQESLEQLQNFRAANFARAALTAFLDHNDGGALEYARGYLDSDYADMRIIAIKHVGRFGEESDATRLVDIATSSYGETKTAATKAALSLEPGWGKVCRALVDSSEAELVRAALNQLSQDDVVQQEDHLFDLLSHKEDGIRVLVLAVMVKHLDDSKLEALLARYLGLSYHFYNVVCWLDRVLFAPAPLADGFRTELLSGLSL